MTKQDFRNRVKGLFSVRWIKNDGTVGERIGERGKGGKEGNGQVKLST
jgi:hypothetical protein